MAVDDAAVPDAAEVAMVRDLVTRLKPLDQRLIYLQNWADMPLREIAARLQMPEGTVKIRLHRARASLRKMIEDEA